MTAEPSRFVRLGLAFGVLGHLLLALALMAYGGMPTWMHVVYELGVGFAVVLYFATSWERPGRKLAAVLFLALGGSAFARITVGTALIAVGPKVLLAAAVGLPFVALAPAGRGRHALSRLLAAWIVINPVLIGVTGISVLRISYSYDRDRLQADLTRIEQEGKAEVLISSLEIGLFDPRALLVVGDERIAAFSDTSGLGERFGAVAAPGLLLTPEITTGLVFDPVRSAILGIGDTDRSDGDRPSNRVYRYELSSHRLEEAPLPRHWAVSAHFDEARRRIYLVHEFGTLSVLNAEDLSLIADLELGVFHVDHGAAAWEVDRVFARSSDGWIAAVDLETLEVQRHYAGLGSEGLGVAASGPRSELYLTYIGGDTFRVLDARTLKEKKSFPVARGVRALGVLGDTGLVGVGAYHDGVLHIADPETGRVLQRVFVGKLIRAIGYDSATHSALVASSIGLVRVPLQAAR